MAGASPKTIPVTRASASVKPSTCQFRLACRVKLSCPLASSQVIDWMPQYATSNPSSAPTKESITLSVSNWRTMRQRPAPRLNRTAISRLRAAAREQEMGNVGAGNGQNEDHHRHEHVKRFGIFPPQRIEAGSAFLHP